MSSTMSPWRGTFVAQLLLKGSCAVCSSRLTCAEPLLVIEGDVRRSGSVAVDRGET